MKNDAYVWVDNLTSQKVCILLTLELIIIDSLEEIQDFFYRF